uniref:CIDE-N domain-containing protein n=1 Tax=Neovison vison TaxID=452646 RepID=A0A8C7ALY3_NEOVI
MRMGPGGARRTERPSGPATEASRPASPQLPVAGSRLCLYEDGTELTADDFWSFPDGSELVLLTAGQTWQGCKWRGCGSVAGKPDWPGRCWGRGARTPTCRGSSRTELGRGSPQHQGELPLLLSRSPVVQLGVLGDLSSF